jgi:hypothetical protein
LEAGGFEPHTKNPYPIANEQLTDIHKSCLASSLAFLLQSYPELGNLIDIWPKLPDHIKSAIQALIQTGTV